MKATLIPTPQAGVVLKNISWQTYESLVNELAEQRGIHLTYDLRNWGFYSRVEPQKPGFFGKSGEDAIIIAETRFLGWLGVEAVGLIHPQSPKISH